MRTRSGFYEFFEGVCIRLAPAILGNVTSIKGELADDYRRGKSKSDFTALL